MYRYAINLNPSFADPYFQIGTIYGNEIYNNYDSSEVYFLKTIKLDPDYWWAYFSLASIYHRFLNKSELAEKYYMKTLEFKPDTSQVHINYAFLCLEKLGDKKKAKEHYLRAIQLQPGLKTKYRDTIFGVKSN